MSAAPRGRRRGALPAAVATAGLALAGSLLLASGMSGAESPVVPAATAVAAVPHPSGAAPAFGPALAAPREAEVDLGPTLQRSRPVTLQVPAIGLVSDRLVELGRLPDGELEVPADYDLAGWYEPGPAPGQFGPAVIAGHVDSTAGPAVFARLAELTPGDTVTVGREDGTTAEFTIDRVERHPKDRFPTVAVYGNTTDRAELRLITCGGEFDRSSGHYRDNVVAFAHLTSVS